MIQTQLTWERNHFDENLFPSGNSSFFFYFTNNGQLDQWTRTVFFDICCSSDGPWFFKKQLCVHVYASAPQWGAPPTALTPSCSMLASTSLHGQAALATFPAAPRFSVFSLQTLSVSEIILFTNMFLCLLCVFPSLALPLCKPLREEI